MCEPSLHGGFGFQRAFCSGIGAQMLGVTDFPGPSATLMRRLNALPWGLGIFLSDEKGSVPNGAIPELLTCWPLESY